MHADLERDRLDDAIDWDIFGKVLIGKLRRALLTELYRPSPDWWTNTPSELRKRMLERHPSGLSNVTNTLHQLEKEGLIKTAGLKKKTQQRLYALSDSGKRIVEMLRD